MTATTNAWSTAAGRQPAIGFVDVVLRGAGQVMFQNNPLTGLLFIVGIAWGAVMADMPAVAIGAVVGLVVSTATAYLLKVDQGALTSGLYGYNGILVGAALPTFLTVDPLLWVYLVVGAAVSSVVLLAIGNVMKSFGAPALTFPFVLTTWFLLLGAYAFSNVPIASMGPPAIPCPGRCRRGHRARPAGPPRDRIRRHLAGVPHRQRRDGRHLRDRPSGQPARAALFAVVGSALALGTALTLGADTTSVSAGLFGFSAVLTAIALATTSTPRACGSSSTRSSGIIFTVIVQGALDVVLTPIGIPTLTAPFIFVTWLFLLPRRTLLRSRTRSSRVALPRRRRVDQQACDGRGGLTTIRRG